MSFLFRLKMLLSLACGLYGVNALAQAEPPVTRVGTVPEAPSIISPIHEVDVERNADGSIKREAPQYYRSIRPTIPPVRTSHDGRLGFNWTNRTLYLLAPEKITRPFPFSEPGMPILTDPAGFYSFIENHLTRPQEQGQPAYFAGAAICNSAPINTQIRRCNGSNECYSLSYVSFRVVKSQNNPKDFFDLAYFRSRRMEIEVQNPKTPNARIVDIRPAGDIVENPRPIEVDYNLTNSGFASFEPMVTSDGRLFVARASYNAIKHIDGPNNTGAKNVDIYYMVAPKDATPCDASAFSYIKRIQNAPFDADMKDSQTGKPRYGIAEHPMRDSFGRLIPRDALFPLYPWIDREGNNLFFSTGGSTLYTYDFSSGKNYTQRPGGVYEWLMNKGSERYPARCIQGVSNCHESPYNPETPDNVRGFAVLGSWTHGKTVVLDGLINASDYGLKRGLQSQRELQLYQAKGNFDGWVRVGPGRDTGGAGSGIDNGLESFEENSEIRGMSVLTGVLDSLENVFNTYRMMRPTLPRDVVWTINNSLGSDEVAFDDYLDPQALIVSSMIAGAEFIRNQNDRNDGWSYRDGFGWGGGFDQPHKRVRPILIQNAATSEKLPIPSWGHLSQGRVEPVALGGIHGRGLWLDGATLTYTFPKAVKTPSLFVSLFVDPRPVNAKAKQILRFPDGTKLLLTNNKIRVSKVFAADNSTITKDFNETLPAARWSHLAIGVSNDGKTVDLYINGMKRHTASFKKKLFQLALQSGNGPLNLVVGANSPAKDQGFKGWIDDFKVLAYVPVAEVICNHAYGSLHFVKSSASDYWRNLSASYPVSTHQDIRKLLPDNFAQEHGIPNDARYVCSADYSDPNGIHRAMLRENENLLALRDALLHAVPRSGGGMEDGRIYWNAPRVDFQASSFCLSCHTSEERRGMTLAALTPGPVCAMNDRRRQPLQPPALLPGLQTEQQLWWIDSNHQQKTKLYTPNGSLYVDPLIQPSKVGSSCQ